MLTDSFDQIVRSFASGFSRRRLLAGLSGSLAIVPSARAKSGSGRKCRKVGKTCDARTTCCGGAECTVARCICKRGWGFCDGACRHLASDPAHCGACGNECDDPRLRCIGGVCLMVGTPEAPPPEHAPDGDIDLGSPISGSTP